MLFRSGASAGTEFSYESGEWKDGVFTYAMLNGITSGKADLNEDGRISVDELKRYTAEQVIKLTAGKQHPVSRGGNLDMDFTVALPQDLLFAKSIETMADAVAISDDGQNIAAIVDRTLRGWNTTTGAETRRLSLGLGFYNLVAKGSTLRITDGQRVTDFPFATGDQTGAVVATEDMILAHPVFSRDGKRFAYLTVQRGSEPVGLLVDANSGKVVATWPQPDFKVNLNQVLAFSPDGSKLAIFDGNRRISVRDGFTGTLESDLKWFGQVQSLAFSHDNHLLVAGTNEDNLLIFDLVSSGNPRILENEDKHNYLPALLFSQDDKILLTGSSDGYIRFVSLPDGSVKHQIWNEDWAYRMTLTPDSHLLAVAGYRGSLRLWDVSQWLDRKKP